MVGSRGLRTRRRLALWWREPLVVELPDDRRQELVASGQAQEFEPVEGRSMNGWAVLADGVDWDPLVAAAQEWTAGQRLLRAAGSWPPSG